MNKNKFINKNQVFSIGPRMGVYLWMTNENMLLKSGKGTIIFEAKAINDIHISFNKDITRSRGQDGMSEEAPIYEIVIGGWLNTKSAIRKLGKQQVSISKKESNLAIIQSIGEFSKYWVSINDGFIIAGKGDIPGINDFIQWKDPQPISNIRYFGFSSWATPIQYRNIKVIPALEEITSKLSLIQQKFSPSFLINNISFHDVIFEIEKQYIYGHRCILACASDYFWNLFINENLKSEYINEINTIIMKFEDISISSFMIILKWCYGSLISIKNLDLSSLLLLEKLSEKFQLIELSNHLKNINYNETKNFLIQPKEIQYKPNFQKLLFNNHLSDITFIVEGEKIASHKAILCLMSEHFFAMFNNPFKESIQNEIILKDISLSTFKAMLDFIYRGNSSSTSIFSYLETIEDVILLLQAADLYNIPFLSQSCCNYLREHLQVDNCCDILTIARLLNISNLDDACVLFIENNFQQVSKTDSFKELSSEILMELLISDNLIITKEEQVYKAVMEWSKTNKKESLNELLGFIRYPLMNKDFLEKIVLNNQIFQENNELFDKVKRALKYVSGDENVLLEDIKAITGIYSKDNKDFYNDILLVMKDSITEPIRPRKGHNFIELIFSFCGDENGVFYFIGTQSKTQRWTNPHKSGKVKVTCSSPFSRYTKPDILVGRAFVTTSYTIGKPPWWSIDLGPDRQLICNHYSLRSDGGNNFVRNWNLQGSNDENSWFDLRIHTNDQSFNTPGQIIAWPVHGKNAITPYRYFRIIVTDNTNILSLCGIELYGYLHKKI